MRQAQHPKRQKFGSFSRSACGLRAATLKDLPHRLLLRNAMERPEAADQVAGRQRADTAAGEQAGENLHGPRVGRVVELRHDRQPIRKVKIAITSRQSHFVMDHRGRGIGSGMTFSDLPAASVNHRKRWRLSWQRGVVFVCADRLPTPPRPCWGDETGLLVDVAVGVVADDAAGQPQILVTAR